MTGTEASFFGQKFWGAAWECIIPRGGSLEINIVFRVPKHPPLHLPDVQGLKVYLVWGLAPSYLYSLCVGILTRTVRIPVSEAPAIV